MKWVVRSDSGAEYELEVKKQDDSLEVKGDYKGKFELLMLDGRVASLRMLENSKSFEVLAKRDGKHWEVVVGGNVFRFRVMSALEAQAGLGGRIGTGASRLEAPIPGRVLKVLVNPGDEVTEGQPMVVLEAMKMENELVAEGEGVVSKVLVKPGDTVETGALLVELDPISRT